MAHSRIAKRTGTERSHKVTNDLLGFSGAAKEIVNAVSAGIGTLYRPRAIKAEADAEAYAVIAKAEAQAEAQLISQAGAGDETALRALQRFKTRLISEQANLEGVINRAIALADARNSGVSTTFSIEPEWLEQFMESAQKISQPEISKLWAQVLARQAVDGTISLRTIELLKSFSRADALAFESFLRIRQALGGTFLPVDGERMIENGLHPEEIQRRSDLGMVDYSRTEWNIVNNQLQQAYRLLTCVLQSGDTLRFCVGDYFVKIKGESGVELFAYDLTNSGKELASTFDLFDMNGIDVRSLLNSFKDIAEVRLGYDVEIFDKNNLAEPPEEYEPLLAGFEDFERMQVETYLNWRNANR